MKTALIFGASGQDGAYLSKLLLDKGYRVHGASRDSNANQFENLRALGIREYVHTESVNLGDFRSVLDALQRIRPDEIYNLSGQSSVGLSFEHPVETMESIAVGTLTLLEAIRFSGGETKLYHAGSSECFGDTGGQSATETTPFAPRSPYAAAKASAFWQAAIYRDAYGLHSCTGILFNHESPLRPQRFVTRKIIAAACRIAAGSDERLTLGDIGIRRDWGWAPEYVDAMWRILQHDTPQDFVIATGEDRSLRDFVAAAFDYAGINWENHVDIDESLFRPTEIRMNRGDPSKAAAELNWRSTNTMADIVRKMMDAEKAVQQQ